MLYAARHQKSASCYSSRLKLIDVTLHVQNHILYTWIQSVFEAPSFFLTYMHGACELPDVFTYEFVALILYRKSPLCSIHITVFQVSTHFQ